MFISFVWGVFVREGFGKGGFCPGSFCPGVYVQGVFVLIPQKTAAQKMMDKKRSDFYVIFVLNF